MLHGSSTDRSTQSSKGGWNIFILAIGRVHGDPFLNRCSAIILTGWNALHPVRRLLKRVSPDRFSYSFLTPITRHDVSHSERTNGIIRVRQCHLIIGQRYQFVGWLISRASAWATPRRPSSSFRPIFERSLSLLSLLWKIRNRSNFFESKNFMNILYKYDISHLYTRIIIFDLFYGF